MVLQLNIRGGNEVELGEPVLMLLRVSRSVRQVLSNDFPAYKTFNTTKSRTVLMCSCLLQAHEHRP